MRLIRIPPRADTLIFDIDGTLYSNRAYAAHQESSQVRRLAMARGLTEDRAAGMLAEARAGRKRMGLPATSMGNLFLGFGIDMASIVRWREEEIRPRDWLVPDAALRDALGKLGRDYRLLALTNNPRKVGLESLEALGVSGLFSGLMGLDDTGESKPSSRPFAVLCERMEADPSVCISVGDRLDVDIEPALALGMGGILVDGVRDLYALPGILAQTAN